MWNDVSQNPSKTAIAITIAIAIALLVLLNTQYNESLNFLQASIRRS